MQHHGLRDGISFCDIDGKLVFLDLGRDRYFALGVAAEDAFRSLADCGGDCDDNGLDLLRGTGLIVPTDAFHPISPANGIRPTRSLVERRDIAVRVRPTLLPEIAARLLTARYRIGRKRLPEAVAALRARSQRSTRAGTAAEDLAPVYLASRRLIPLEPNCLRDSLALASYLKRRRAPFKLVIGVKLSPFAAHCWLQVGDLVLNDSLDSVADFHPILVV